MKIISIVQPWATLVALGEKRFETRSWRTKYRGELGIHASQRAYKAICKHEPFRSALERHGYTAKNLPTGAILAAGRLANCYQVIEYTGTFAVLDNGYMVSGDELMFGDFSLGRFAWEVADVKILDEPLPAKGKLGLWEYPLDEI